MTKKEAIDRLKLIQMSYRIRIEQEDLDALEFAINELEHSDKNIYAGIKPEDADIYYTSDYLSDNKEPDAEAIIEYIKKHNLMDSVKEELKDFVEQYSFLIKKGGNK